MRAARTCALRVLALALAADAAAGARLPVGTTVRAALRVGSSFPSSCPAWALPGASQTLQPLPSPLPAGVTAALAAANATMHTLLDERVAPGFGVSVWYAGREAASWGGGVADTATGRAPDVAHDVLRIASNTKVAVCLLALVFHELGLIASLDDPVRVYAPDFSGPADVFGDGASVTFAMLMSHSAGLPDSLPGFADWGNVSTTAVWDAIRRLPAIAPLGTSPLYSNLGFAVLGHVLAEYVAPAAERGDLGALLDAYVLRPALAPLGLDGDAGYALTPAARARLAPGYDSDGAAEPWLDMGWAAPAGAMWASVRALAALHQAAATVAAGGRVPGLALSPAATRAWLQRTFLAPDDSMHVGAPWETFLPPSQGVALRSKSGSLPGYTSWSAVVPELRLSFALWVNGGVGLEAAVLEVAAALVPAFAAVAAAGAPPAPAGPAPADYVGTYVQTANPANTAAVAVDARGQLVLTAFGARSVLAFSAAAPPDVFRAARDAADGAPPSCSGVFGAGDFASAVAFRRDAATGAVDGIFLVNWLGVWVKQPAAAAAAGASS